MNTVRLIILFLGLASGMMAQKLHKDYSFYPQESGGLYFVYPQKGFESKDAEAVKGFEYDITYHAKQDSASYSFSYYTKNVFKIERVTILSSSGENVYAGAASVYFVQPKKKNWHQRASIKIPYALLVQLYNKNQPYILSLSNGDKEIRYVMNPKAWSKQSLTVSRIFQIVEHNL